MRRFFALLAILTGLAAVGTPANAAMASDVCQQISSGEISTAVKAEQCICEAKRRGTDLKIDGPKRCKRPKAVIIYVPTVQLGIDRAHT